MTKTHTFKGEKSRSQSFTIRLPLADYAYVLRESFGTGLNKGMLTIVHTMMHLEAEAWDRLKGKFTSGEWKLMALVFRYEPVEDENRLDGRLLQYALLHSTTAETCAEKYDVDLLALGDKLGALSLLGAFAVCTRCRDFWLVNKEWRSDEAHSISRLNKWAEY